MVDEAPMVDRWAAVCEAMARLLSPHAEVVLHDPRTDRVLAVWNALSGRVPGDPSLLSELDGRRPDGRDVYGPYPKTLADGRRLSSVSAVMRDSTGEPEVVLCVNVDRTAFDEAARLLTGFAAPAEERPPALFHRDWTETLNDIVGTHVRATGISVDRMTRADRLAVVAALDGAGIFSRRRSVPAVAHALHASRSAVYQLLADTRKATPHP